MTAILYRSGTIAAPNYPDWLQKRIEFIDRFRPSGHHPRSGVLFCSPDEDGFFQWHNSAYNQTPTRIWACAKLTRLWELRGRKLLLASGHAKKTAAFTQLSLMNRQLDTTMMRSQDLAAANTT